MARCNGGHFRPQLMTFAHLWCDKRANVCAVISYRTSNGVVHNLVRIWFAPWVKRSQSQSATNMTIKVRINFRSWYSCGQHCPSIWHPAPDQILKTNSKGGRKILQKCSWRSGWERAEVLAQLKPHWPCTWGPSRIQLCKVLKSVSLLTTSSCAKVVLGGPCNLWTGHHWYEWPNWGKWGFGV